ncbi:hypothetical protein ETH_00026770 [Eimeria tenella]|uniref:E3 ubiquitin-protein ligase synoviolin-like TPR repeats domain-containing protein n=1 Tax=Eimeria tenella TaxID=5802 RepID=U6KN05_EIMTE|nr:hypothetical protein ETH_00026770 [Eimeria tenella]CDJ37672.1 hypothetical protein ETH_00026770 [Eimeria tenella]|eukprot:XP_013228510.1 hypothetical protein ETH_00026770 [Eimeria tenella]
MANLVDCFRAYTLASFAAVAVLLLHTWLRCDEFYAAIAKLTTSKLALAVEYNCCVVLFLLGVKLLLHLLVGRLRGLEVEQMAVAKSEEMAFRRPKKAANSRDLKAEETDK